MSLSRSFRLLVAAAGLFLVPSVAGATITVTEKTVYYDVDGADGLELSKGMLEGGSRSIPIAHAIASTATKFDFVDPKVSVRGNRCVVDDVTVKLEITYTYPRIRGGRLSATLAPVWDEFYAELVKHEQTHARIAKEVAKKLEKTLKGVSGTVAIGCNDFGNNATLKLGMIGNELKWRQRAFDQREQLFFSRISRLQSRLLRSR